MKRIHKTESKWKKRYKHACIQLSMEKGHFFPTNFNDPCYSRRPMVNILLETPARCSCNACGNPRKYGKGKYKQTIQERKLGICNKETEIF